MVPKGLCIYCGHGRAPDDASAACPHCGHTAEGVRWWPLAAGGRSPSGVVLGALFALVLGGFVASTAAHLEAASYAVAAAVSALVSWPLLRALFRREPGTWAFATLDGERIGTAAWDGARLFWAWGVRARGAAVDVPDYARAITASAARAAGVRSLGPGVCLALKIDEREYDELFPERSMAPVIAAALAGMAAREGCALHWQHGWRYARFAATPLAPFQRMVITSGAAPSEGAWLERRLLSVIAKAEGASAAAWRVRGEGDEAHYRAQGAAPAARFCALDDLARDLAASPAFRDECVAHVEPDAARAGEAAMAFRAFAAANPEVVEHLLASLGEG